MSAGLPYNISINPHTRSATLKCQADYGTGQLDINLYSNSGYHYWERYVRCSPYERVTYEITGLDPNTTYYVKIRSIDSGGAWDGSYTSSYYFTTDKEQSDCPFIPLLTRSTDDGIEIYCNRNMPFNFNIEYYTSINSSIITNSNPAYIDLKSSCRVYYRSKCWYNGVRCLGEWNNFDYTRPIRPSDSHFFNFLAGQTLACEKIGDRNYNIYIMPAQTWCNFVVRVNDFRRYKGYGNYTFIRVTSGTTFTANIYNDMIDALSAIIPGSIPKVAPNDNITAERLMILQMKLNSIN